MELPENVTPDVLNDLIVQNVQSCVQAAEDYQTSVIIPTMKERYQIYFADKDYYKEKFPRLSKTSSLVSTDVTDTIEWALPSLIRVFTSGDEVISVQGASEEDDKNAEVMQKLVDFQLQRQNHFTTILYNWIKDSFITGLGVVKCYWDREERFTPTTVTLNAQALQELQQTGVEISEISPPDEYGDFRVTYQSPYYVKNAPKIENILISEFLYDPKAKNIDEADFVAQRKEVTMSYLRQMEKQGVYANVEQVKPSNLYVSSNYYSADQELKNALGDDYETWRPEMDEARQKAVIYECYIKMDVNGDGILEDMIVTIADDIILRIEENYMGRHPFFTLSPMSDPHRVWAKRSYAELVGEIQHLKTAIQRQVVTNLALSNDPKMILSPEAINMDDYNKGRNVIRKKAGFAMSDVAMSMPVNQFSPATFNYLEYLEGQKEQRTGITRYNQGLDGSSLNKTASGISAIMQASNQRLDLIARMFAETGIYQLYRFLISLNQRFIDQETVIRLTNETLEIHPEDLEGNFDLIISAGISVQSKQETAMGLQQLLSALYQSQQAGVPLATPKNYYNLFKAWADNIGIKNANKFISDPAVVQEKAMIELQVMQQVLASLPDELRQFYMENGWLPPQIVALFPPWIQLLIGGRLIGPQNGSFEENQAGTAGTGGGSAGYNGAGGGAGGVGIGANRTVDPATGRGDNRLPQNVPRAGNGPVQEPSQSFGSFARIS